MSGVPAYLKCIPRLHVTIAAVCPIVGVSIAALNDGSYEAAAEATVGEIAAADAALATFDWSEAAHATWETTQIRSQAVDHDSVKDNRAVMLRAISLVILDEVNILRVAAGLAPRTTQQFKNAIASKINSGDAD